MESVDQSPKEAFIYVVYINIGRRRMLREWQNEFAPTKIMSFITFNVGTGMGARRGAVQSGRFW